MTTAETLYLTASKISHSAIAKEVSSIIDSCTARANEGKFNAELSWISEPARKILSEPPHSFTLKQISTSLQENCWLVSFDQSLNT